MSNEIVQKQSFEEKLRNKIRDSIGDLMSDEDLSKLVSRGIEESFFTKRPNPKKSSYYSSTEPEYLPPLIHELLSEHIKPLVNTQIAEYVKEHNEEVMAVVRQVVSAGVGNAVITAMNMQFSNQLINFQTNIQQQLNNR